MHDQKQAHPANGETSPAITHEIRLNGQQIVKGDQCSINIVFRNLIGLNFINPQSWQTQTHQQYIAMMEQEWQVSLSSGLLELAEIGQPAIDEHQIVSPRKITYGDGNAIILLASEQMGRKVRFIEVAQQQLAGEVIRPMEAMNIEREAVLLADSIRHHPALVKQANDIADRIKARHGFIPSEIRA